MACDLLVLWGERGVVQRLFRPLELWRAQCSGAVSGRPVPSGHYIPEQLPELSADALREFLFDLFPGLLAVYSKSDL